MRNWKSKEIQAKRAIEDRWFTVHDANIVFNQNCQNIDLIVYSKDMAQYIQVKSSETPASKDCVIIDGSPWTEDQLYYNAPIFNKHDHFRAKFVFIVDKTKSGETIFYIAPPVELESLLRRRGLEIAKRPKKDGTRRSIKFRKELPRDALKSWMNAWKLLGEAPQSPESLNHRTPQGSERRADTSDNKLRGTMVDCEKGQPRFRPTVAEGVDEWVNELLKDPIKNGK
ncbi:hypothetical protein [Rhodoblastus sp.]|uniref:hypothetical protein n=1 Tax=Rhodoblastus sp. TaxID=1962975 RepID=UPI003F98E167